MKGANLFSCQAGWMAMQKVDILTHAALFAASPAPAQPVVSYNANFNSFHTGRSNHTAQEQVPDHQPPTSHPPTTHPAL